MGSSGLKFDVTPASDSHESSVIFLHGSGDTSQGIQERIESVLGHNLSFPRSRVIYPSAPPRPYTVMGGALSTVWFDRQEIAQNVPEDLESIDPMCTKIGQLIQREVDLGIPKNKIILGGLSMGGCMAMHTAYRFHRELAGVFALSAFLNDKSSVYQELRATDSRKPPLFACHGQADELVPYAWGESTMSRLREAGVHCQFTTFPTLAHEMNREELQKLQIWIQETIS